MPLLKELLLQGINPGDCLEMDDRRVSVVAVAEKKPAGIYITPPNPQIYRKLWGSNLFLYTGGRLISIGTQADYNLVENREGVVVQGLYNPDYELRRCTD
jgi:hypothetical protein